jgi:hypothetical protein
VTVTVSEDLNAATRSPERFCATLNADTDLDRAGFGPTERVALWALAAQLGIPPLALQAQATIERMATR